MSDVCLYASATLRYSADPQISTATAVSSDAVHDATCSLVPRLLDAGASEAG